MNGIARGLAAAHFLVFAAGCASEQESAPQREIKVDSQLSFSIDLDPPSSTTVTHKLTGDTASTRDLCGAYLQSSAEVEKLFDAVACTHIAVLTGTAPEAQKPRIPPSFRCGIIIAPQLPTRMKTTMDDYCGQNPQRPLREAIELYWDESLNGGSFY